MKRIGSTSDVPAEHKICDRCLDPVYQCRCLRTALEEWQAPAVVWLASRTFSPNSVVRHEKKHRYEKACREVERLNRLYAGKVQHFLLPVS